MFYTLLWSVGFLMIIRLLLRLYKTLITYMKLCVAMRQLPGPEPHWLRGDIPKEFSGDILKQYEKDMTMYGKFQRRWLGPSHAGIIAYYPSMAQNILTKFSVKSEYLYRLLHPFMGDSLGTSNGAKWKHDRKMLNPIFHTTAMMSYIQVFNRATKTLKNHLENNERFSVIDFFGKLSLDIFTQCAFSVDMNCHGGAMDDFQNAVDDIREIIFQRFTKFYYYVDWMYYKTDLYKRQVRCLSILQGHATKLINERRKKYSQSSLLEGNNKKRTDFLDILLNSEGINGDKLSDDEIMFHIHTFMGAAYDTTSTTLSWLFYFLAKNQEHQDKCREEIRQVLKDRDEVTWEDTKKWNHVTNCIKEALRMRPPIPMTGRQVTKSVSLNDILGTSFKGKKNVTFPEESFVQVNLYNIHNNPDVWEKPGEFNPCRFENTDKLHSCAFIPFSAGPRNCIGQHFAMLEMKVAVALLLKNTKFSIGQDFVEPGIAIRVTLKPAVEFYLKITQLV